MDCSLTYTKRKDNYMKMVFEKDVGHSKLKL